MSSFLPRPRSAVIRAAAINAPDQSIDPLDDYPVHQAPESVARPATSNRNFFDRYFFNGYDPRGQFFFGAALGLYPNRGVIDGAFSIAHAGEQLSVFASGRLPTDRRETRVGPFAIVVAEPMRCLEVIIDGPEVAGHLVFDACTRPVEEPRYQRRVEGRLEIDHSRLTQWGDWSGTLDLDGQRLDVGELGITGTRDRSWGVRPVGEPEPGRRVLPQYFWLWATLRLPDRCVLFSVNEDAAGQRWHEQGTVVPLDATQPGERAHAVGYRVAWEPRSRRCASAEIVLGDGDGEERFELEPLARLQMSGLGYLHPEWGHGMWKGSSALHVERLRLGQLDPLSLRNLHVQELCRVRGGGVEGLGVLEQLVIGPHAPSGFRRTNDGFLSHPGSGTP